MKIRNPYGRIVDVSQKDAEYWLAQEGWSRLEEGTEAEGGRCVEQRSPLRILLVAQEGADMLAQATQEALGGLRPWFGLCVAPDAEGSCGDDLYVLRDPSVRGQANEIVDRARTWLCDMIVFQEGWPSQLPDLVKRALPDRKALMISALGLLISL